MSWDLLSTLGGLLGGGLTGGSGLTTAQVQQRYEQFVALMRARLDVAEQIWPGQDISRQVWDMELFAHDPEVIVAAVKGLLDANYDDLALADVDVLLDAFPAFEEVWRTNPRPDFARVTCDRLCDLCDEWNGREVE